MRKKSCVQGEGEGGFLGGSGGGGGSGEATLIYRQWNPGLTICQESSKIISLNREYRYIGVLPHTFYYNFC